MTGWSHGKEALKSDSYDILKGSYYVNCAFYQGEGTVVEPSSEFPEFTAPNIYPNQSSLPYFRDILEGLCSLIIDTAALVARACDKYATAYVENYEPKSLERIVRTSTVTKARLLHYFPPSLSSLRGGTLAGTAVPDPGSSDQDTWCATHVDHGCLTGLTSAVYIDESAIAPGSLTPNRPDQTSPLPILPTMPSSPDPDAGLYIYARDSTVTKVSIPHDCLAFQTGEALQVMTGGKFRAVPHFVRAGGRASAGVARNTLAVFTQPNLEEIVDRMKGTTFGECSREVVGRFG